MYKTSEAVNIAFNYLSQSAGKNSEEIDSIYEKYLAEINEKPLERDIFHKLAHDFNNYKE